MVLLVVLSGGVFMLISGYVEDSYRLVALFLILILSSNIIVDIILYD